MIKTDVEKFFGDGSPMRTIGRKEGEFKYEPRPQQVEMALAVASAMDDGCNLCVEAPTGVGKTFAYLVPAVLRAKQTGKAVIVSTHTINLQEQIISRDVPLLERMLGQEIKAVVAKGKSNYLCLRRLSAIMDMDQGLLALDGIGGDLMRLHNWVNKTTTGDHGEMPYGISPQLWNAVCCERGNCPNGKCDYFRRCFMQRARREVKAAEIVIANHAKFFTSLAMEEETESLNSKGDGDGADSLLPEYTAVILDEGHTLEDCASSHLGLRADTVNLKYLLNRLYNNDRKTGLAASESYTELRNAAIDCNRRCDMFFSRLVEWLEPQRQNPLRYSVPGHIENYLGTPLAGLMRRLKDAVDREEDEGSKAEMQAVLDGLSEQTEALETFFSMSLPDYVYWFEREGANLHEVSLNVVPVDVAPILSEMLFSKPPIIITSATLAVNGNIGYFQRRVGCPDSRTLILDTPFDYMRQVTLHIAGNMPDPRDGEAFLEGAVHNIQHFLRMTKGRAFVLFTSYSMMHDMAKKMEQFFEDENYPLLVQGDGLSPRKMLEEFRNTSGSVIFGTSSFWTGVDVPGDALSNVIIMRLPFAVPDHPLIKARTERVENQGMNSFFDYSVPEAVLKFRQGFGRLIRTKDDTGIVVILDSRVISKRYGKMFLDSIPQCSREIF